MSLKKEIDNDFILAYKAKDTSKVSVLRMIKAEIKNKEIETKTELTDQDIFALLQKQIKQREESAAAYKQGGRDDLSAEEVKEIEIIKHYLPEELSDEDLSKIIEEAIKKIDAKSPADFGKVMGLVMPQTKGRASGLRVQAMVKEKIG